MFSNYTASGGFIETQDSVICWWYCECQPEANTVFRIVEVRHICETKCEKFHKKSWTKQTCERYMSPELYEQNDKNCKFSTSL